MKEILFEAIKDARDRVQLRIMGTLISVSMPKSFWQQAIKRFEELRILDRDLHQHEVRRKEQVIDMLKEVTKKDKKGVRKNG